ncbi:MAG: phenylacetate--CoA ligase family protein [Deltaproteobacteria bacterium]|nr:phenylacetate--CoA ligase family protein [Deltaproteobacteria bacterium]
MAERDPNRFFWNPETESLSRDEMRELQWKKLQTQLKYNYENSLFYQRSFDAANIKPKDIRTWDDFYKHVPMMTKDDQRRAQEESLERFGHPYGMLRCAPREKIVRISSTSGTTGMPTLYTLTKHDVAVNRELHARKLWRTGARPGYIALHAFGLSMFTGGVPVVDAMQEYGCCVVPVGAESGVTRVLQHIDLCKPDFLACTPSFALHIIEKCPEILGKPASALGIQAVSCGAEPGAGIIEIAKRIEEGFGLKPGTLKDAIGGSHNFHGYTCEARPYQGMHLVSEDYCVLELLDPETKQSLELKDNVVGEMCYTYIDWEGTPLLRYRLGDMLHVLTSPCACGDHRLRFQLIGRADDMMIIKGVNLYPAALQNVVSSFVPRTTGELRILLKNPPPRVEPPLQIQVEYGEGMTENDVETLRKDMKNKMHQELRVSPAIEFVPPNTFERATHKSKLMVKLYEQK